MSLKKFFDEAMLLELAKQENDLGIWTVCWKKQTKRLFSTILVKLFAELLERVLPDALSRVHHQLHEVMRVVLRSTLDCSPHSHSRITPSISWQLKR